MIVQGMMPLQIVERSSLPSLITPNPIDPVTWSVSVSGVKTLRPALKVAIGEGVRIEGIGVPWRSGPIQQPFLGAYPALLICNKQMIRAAPWQEG